MNIVVCLEQVPDPRGPLGLHPASETPERSRGLAVEDSDRYGVEVALRLLDQSGGGEVTLVSLTPGGEAPGLRAALATGADRALLVSDPALAGSDALGISRVLAAAVERVGADLVLCANETSDGYAGTVPAQLAELLGWPAVGFAERVQIAPEGVQVRRRTERGFDEISCPLPAVVAVTAGTVEVRRPSLRGVAEARSKPVEILRLSDLGIDDDFVGPRGARQRVVAIETEEQVPGRMLVDDGTAYQQIVELLVSWGVL